MRVVLLFAVALLVSSLSRPACQAKILADQAQFQLLNRYPRRLLRPRRPVKISRCWEPEMPLREAASRSWVLMGIRTQSGIRSSWRRSGSRLLSTTSTWLTELSWWSRNCPPAQLRTRSGLGAVLTRVCSKRVSSTSIRKMARRWRSPIEPARRLNEVLIVTLDSPSWVGWREVRVFGSLSADPMGGAVEGHSVEGDTEATGTKQAAAELSAPLGENVAALGSGFASAGEESAHLAVDGDPNSFWTAQLQAPQWYSVSFDELYLVDKLEMVIAQSPAGPSTHEVWLGNGSGTRTLYRRFDGLQTEDGQTVEVPIVPPRSISEVLVLTLDSPSWVAWREIRVFGSPTSDPIGEAGLPRFGLRKIADGLKLPVHVTHAGDGSGRLFAVEQEGRIRIVRNGTVEETPFLDISGRVRCCGERGLLNVAFSPDYAGKQYFYVSYTDKPGIP